MNDSGLDALLETTRLEVAAQRRLHEELQRRVQKDAELVRRPLRPAG